jgi:HSP20 family protein
MNNLTDQLDAILDLRRRLYRALDSEAAPSGTPATAFAPPLDIVRLPDAIEITVELPGLSREEVDVELEGDLLTISGERQAPDAKGFFRRERPCGAFRRSLSLPGVTEPDLSATLKDGVLTVRVKRAG